MVPVANNEEKNVTCVALRDRGTETIECTRQQFLEGLKLHSEAWANVGNGRAPPNLNKKTSNVHQTHQNILENQRFEPRGAYI